MLEEETTTKWGANMNARQEALSVLLKIEKNKSYSNIAIAGVLKDESLEGADKAFFTALVYGTVERLLTLDYNLSLYLKQPLKKLKPEVLCILRMGAYQILFMDKVPNSAAINESVNLVKKKASFASGLVNAVLRKVSDGGLLLPKEPKEFRSNLETLKFLEIKYSCPTDLIKLFIESYGMENAIGILEHSVGTQPITIRVNTTKTTTEELIHILKEEGVEAVPHKAFKEGVYEELEDALCLLKPGRIETFKSFKDGLFHVQDASSQLCCKKLGVKPKDIVMDVCAAPGGKSFTLSELMKDEGTLYSFDLYPQRVSLISSGAKRLCLSCIKTDTKDAGVFYEDLPQFDKVLCDVPCAGLGIIGRKPEIRYKDLSDIDNLPDLQYHILTISSRYLKPLGRLVYSTCSLNPRENTEVVEKFIRAHKNFKLISAETVMPHIYNSDGFFVAVLERME